MLPQTGPACKETSQNRYDILRIHPTRDNLRYDEGRDRIVEPAMMHWSLALYNLALWVGILLGFPVWGLYLLTTAKARAGLAEKLGRYPEDLLARVAAIPAGKKRVWFHAVSVGEFNAIRPLITEMAEMQAGHQVLISTTTLTGNTLAKKTFPNLPVFYFPLDYRPLIHGTMQRFRPDLAILTETELWPNMIDIVGRQIPLILINGRISQKSYRGYKPLRPLMSAVLPRMTHLYMQSQGDVDRIRDLGNLPPEQATVAGNIKFDLNAVVDPMQRHILLNLLGFGPQDTVLTLASTHAGEEQYLVSQYQKLHKDFPELKLVIAPRHPERTGEIRGILNTKALSYSVRSQLSESNPNRENIVILDTIGELLTVYSLSTLAIMGGSFIERGGQNPLEPLSQRIPVIFGPHMTNFPEITRLILEQQAGYQVHSAEELSAAVTELLTQPEIYSTVVENGQQLLENNRGTKEIFSEAIHDLMRGVQD